MQNIGGSLPLVTALLGWVFQRVTVHKAHLKVAPYINIFFSMLKQFV